MNTTAAQPGSAYIIEETREPVSSHTLSIIVDNEPGVLARVIGLRLDVHDLAGLAVVANDTAVLAIGVDEIAVERIDDREHAVARQHLIPVLIGNALTIAN